MLTSLKPHVKKCRGTVPATQFSPSRCQVRQYAEKYFGNWRDARGATPPTLADGAQPSAAPNGDSSREFEQKSLAGPAVLHAFYRPGAGGADTLELDVVRCEKHPMKDDEKAGQRDKENEATTTYRTAHSTRGKAVRGGRQPAGQLAGLLQSA